MIEARTPDGVAHQFPDDTPREVIDQTIRKYLEDKKQSKEIEDRGVLESLARGVASGVVGGGNQILTGAASGLGALAGIAGENPVSQGLADYAGNQRKLWKELDPAKGDDSWSSMIGQAAGAIPNFLNPVTRAGTMVGSALNSGAEHLDAGGTMPGAIASSMTDAGMFGAGIAATPQMLKGRVGNAMAGAAVNTGQEALNREFQQSLREADQAKQLPNFSLKEGVVSSLPGAAFGYMNPKPSSSGPNLPPRTPSGAPPNEVARDPDSFANRAIPVLDKAYEVTAKRLEEQQKKLQYLEQAVQSGQAQKTPKFAAALQKMTQDIALLEKDLQDIRAQKQDYEAWLNRNNPEYRDARNQRPQANAEGEAAGMERTNYPPAEGAQTRPEGRRPTLVTQEDLASIPPEGSAQRPVFDEGKPLSEEDFLQMWDEQAGKPPEQVKEAQAPLIKDVVENGSQHVTPPPLVPEQLSLDLTSVDATKKAVENRETYAFQLKDPAVAEKIQQGKWKEALEIIARPDPEVLAQKYLEIGKMDRVEPRSMFSTLASWFIKNKNMDFTTTPFDDLPKADKDYLGEHLAFYDTVSDRIGHRKGQEGIVEHVLHEYTHRASAKFLDFVRAYRIRDQLSDTAQTRLEYWYGQQDKQILRATENVIDLYDTVKKAFPGTEKGLKIGIYEIPDIHEFFSWGLTKPGFQGVLADIILVPNAFAKTDVESKKPKGYYTGVIVTPLVKKVTNMLAEVRKFIKITLGKADNAEQLTALDALLENARPIIEGSYGHPQTHQQRKMFQIEELDSTKHAARNLAEDFLATKSVAEDPFTLDVLKQYAARVPDLGSWNPMKFFAGKQQYSEMIKKNPVGAQIARVLRLAEDTKNKFYAEYMNGTVRPDEVNLMGVLSERFRTVDPNSLNWHLKNTKPSDWEAVRIAMQNAGSGRIPHATMIRSHLGHLTREQVKLYEDLARVMEFSKQFGNGVISKYSGKKWADFPGYYPLVRKGEWEVMASYRTAPLRQERFRTKFEAEEFRKKILADPAYRGADISDVQDVVQRRKDEPARVEALRQQVERARQQVARGTLQPFELRVLEAELRDASTRNPLGGHALRRLGVPGAEGEKLYKTTAELTEEFRQSFIDYGQEIASLAHRKIIDGYTDVMLNDPDLQTSHRNALEVADYLRNYATGKFDAVGEGMQKGLENFVDTTFTKAVQLVHKDWFPQTHVGEKGLGIMNRLFYISALTTRPGFWAGQILTSPFAVRQLFKTGTTLDAVASLGRGMVHVLSPKKTPDFMEMLHYAATRTDSLHPSFQMELNRFFDISMKRETKGQEAMRNIKDKAQLLSGEEFAGGADALSRYITMAMFYEHYKAQGFRGEDLFRRTLADVDSTMVTYNQKNKAPYLQKLGKAGQAVAPLMTFSTAQWANLVADFKYMQHNRNLKSTLPFIATGLTTMLMAGAIGLPFVAEYEFLKWSLTKLWPDVGNSMPSLLDFLTEKEAEGIRVAGMQLPKGAVAYGLPSGITGIDFGSSLRWNPLISRMLTENQSPLSVIPAANWGWDMAEAAWTYGRTLTDNPPTTEDARKAAMKASSLMIGGKGMADLAFGANEREMVPGGARGYAQREQTWRETAAPFIGSSTLQAQRLRAADRLIRQQEEIRSQQRQSAIDKLTDAILEGDDRKYDRALEKLYELEVPQEAIERQVKEAYRKRMVPDYIRKFTDRKGNITSKEQQRKYRDYEKYYDKD